MEKCLRVTNVSTYRDGGSVGVEAYNFYEGEDEFYVINNAIGSGEERGDIWKNGHPGDGNSVKTTPEFNDEVLRALEKFLIENQERYYHIQKTIHEICDMSEDKDFEKQHVQFVNESDLKFIDISSEKAREYANEKGVFCYIDKPLKLHVSESGGHRVFTANNECYYVRPDEGWYVRWIAKEGEANFVK